MTVATLAVAVPAQAAPDLNCDAYATAATEQNAQAKSLGCGFSGSRWSDNYAGHRTWCLKEGVGIMDVSREDQLRKDELQTCKARVSECDAYAQGAVDAAAKNAADKCGYTGGRWSTNYAGHKTWCMKASPAAIAKEIKIRSEGISQCVIGDGGNLPKQ